MSTQSTTIVAGRYVGYDNTEEVVTPADGCAFSNEEVTNYVKGYSCIWGRLPDDFVVLGDICAAFKNKPINAKVTRMLGSSVYGDCLICKSGTYKFE